ncbi:Phosphoenolpyruvate synthase / Pyruvate phosphate dikinase [hydrothermal vent metagenome]|uniref:Phosphoenolpyruvate synthase / Pyruvate phosphate dikinase n=1 Tax=hydrothermal vent metagenome TaxID=652676 RepID=A0A3B0YQH2_9ZZZZ
MNNMKTTIKENSKETLIESANSNVNFVILGAGKPADGEQHTALRGLSEHSRVLDWVLQAVDFLHPSVTFVGGYQVNDICQRYPDFHYVINTEWESSSAVVSFLNTRMSPASDYYVSYADIVYREKIVTEMNAHRSDIVVAVDSDWKQRFEGRSNHDLVRCEKVNCHEGTVTRLGNDIDPNMADAEFVGLVRFSPRVISFLQHHTIELFELFKQDKISKLVEFLRIKGFKVNSVDITGDWAELNEPQDLAHFVLGTKAQTLSRLQKLIRCSRIEDQVSFSVLEWQENTDKIIHKIQHSFQHKPLVIRSSALAEDGFSSANAGVYTSILNVDPTKPLTIGTAVNEVINSYTDSSFVNQVLVQPMVDNVVVSGVIFTRTLVRGAPYYVINYDDVTKSTESITSGSGEGHKTLIVHRSLKLDMNQVPQLLRGLFEAIQEIENLLNYESLDIEFAISDQSQNIEKTKTKTKTKTETQIHILQVRPIAVQHGDYATEQQVLEDVLQRGEQYFEMVQQSSPFVVGSKAFFGVMPDWNPAEIIGTNPGILAISLYRSLIMDDIWARQRAEYGYRDVRPHTLLHLFCGRPYVDIRASFNSFIPAGLDNGLATRLVDFYMSWLESHPHLHDKIEFEVVPTCIDLDFDRWSTRLIERGDFTANEVSDLKLALLSITRSAFSKLDQDLDCISTLDNRYDDIVSSGCDPLRQAILLLEDAKVGTLAFAHLARNAFVAVTLLRSAVSKGVIDQVAMDVFLRSIRTVTHEFTDDAINANKSPAWEAFVKKYGHLRPGTYDITSLAYKDDTEKYLRSVVEQTNTGSRHGEQEKDMQPWVEQRSAFAKACHNIGLPGDIEILERFLRQSIEGREYAKFKFTRNISTALSALVQFGEAQQLTRQELSNIPLATLVTLSSGSFDLGDTSSSLKKQASEGKRQRMIAGQIELPPLITQCSDFRGFMYPENLANFVGNSRIVADCINLEQKHNDDTSLKGKIVLIPQADPGYDWLFGQQISGLITLYGGANSHMAIRTAEFGLPAAIGIGQTEYSRLSTAFILELDAANQRIQIVQ